MTPDLETQLGRVADATDPTSDPIHLAELVTRRTSRRPARVGPVVLRVAAGLLVVGLLAAVVAALADDPDRRERTYSVVPPTASETANADLLAPGGVQVLPPAPIEGRSDAATVWTGTEVFIWGGNDESIGRNFADGATFDVRRGEWTVLPPAPLRARTEATAVWTGTEVLVWGGVANKDIPSGTDPDLTDGAAFDPATRAWRAIDDAPIPGRYGGRAVWTGEEMVVLTGRDRAEGAAYDPTDDEWRRIADPPAPLAQSFTQAVWTGHRVVAPLGPPSSGETLGVFAYDPVDDVWEDYRQPQGADRPDRIVWAGDRILQIPVDRPPSVRDPVTGRWAVAGDAPPVVVATTRQAPRALWTGERAVVWGPGFVAAFDPDRGTWAVTGEDRQPTDVAAGASVVWADGVLFAWGGFPAEEGGALTRPPEPSPTTATETERWSECRTDAPSPAPERGDEPTLEPGANHFGAELADGRAYDVEITDGGYDLSIEGEAGSTSSGPAIASGTTWSYSSGDDEPDPASELRLALGIRPPGAVRTSVVDDQGVARCEGISYSPDGRWFAIPDVDPNWIVVHEDADGDPVVDPVTGSGPCTVDNDCPTP